MPVDATSPIRAAGAGLRDRVEAARYCGPKPICDAEARPSDRLPEDDGARQVAFGVERQNPRGRKLAAQRWIACVSADETRALTIVSDSTAGFDFLRQRTEALLLAGPRLRGPSRRRRHPDRQADASRSGSIAAGMSSASGSMADRPLERLAAIDRQATARQEAPMALRGFPSGEGKPAVPGIVLSDAATQMSAMKLADDGRRLIVRLFEPTGTAPGDEADVPALGAAPR